MKVDKDKVEAEICRRREVLRLIPVYEAYETSGELTAYATAVPVLQKDKADSVEVVSELLGLEFFSL